MIFYDANHAAQEISKILEDGKIAEHGNHDELIKKEGRYFDLYTYQARI